MTELDSIIKDFVDLKNRYYARKREPDSRFSIPILPIGFTSYKERNITGVVRNRMVVQLYYNKPRKKITIRSTNRFSASRPEEVKGYADVLYVNPIDFDLREEGYNPPVPRMTARITSRNFPNAVSIHEFDKAYHTFFQHSVRIPITFKYSTHDFFIGFQTKSGLLFSRSHVGNENTVLELKADGDCSLIMQKDYYDEVIQKMMKQHDIKPMMPLNGVLL